MTIRVAAANVVFATCVCFPACVLVGVAAWAAPADDASDHALNDIVITATRVPEPAAKALEPVLVIDRAALEQSLAIDVGDVLRFHAGLDLGRNGGPGQPLSLFIRGANSDQSIVMLDGVRINSGTLALAPLSNLGPELIERIEIVKGPRSAIYGTDAIGGVVNLITRTDAASGADAMLDYGRYGTGGFAADANYASAGTSVQAALSGQRTSGFPTFTADSLDRGYKNLSGTAAVTTHVAGVELGARYWQVSGDTQYSNPLYNADFTAITAYAPVGERFTDSLVAAHAAGDLSSIWHARVTLSRVIDDLRQNQVPDFDYTSRDTIDVQNDVKLAGTVNQLLTFGAVAYDERTNSSTYGTGYSVDTHAQTYYLQDQLDAGAHRLLLAVGDAHHPAFGNHPTWNAEYGYSLTADTLLIAAAGTAFRAPSATDRFGYGGTPDLLPETSRNFEVGVKSRLNVHQELTFAAFQNTITDLIVFVNDPANPVYFGENQNVDRARIRGLEAGWAFENDPWVVRAEASVQDPKNLDTDAQLLRRTRHSLTVSGTRRIDRGEVGVDLLSAGARADVDVVSNGPVRDGGYVLAALHGALHLTPAWVLTARLDNAFDRRYSLANGYNTAGRAASIAARYAFR